MSAAVAVVASQRQHPRQLLRLQRHGVREETMEEEDREEEEEEEEEEEDG